ncbi:MAG: haloacid dehalogenase, partial [Planctomycetota bacterium]
VARSLGKPGFFRGVATRPLAFVGDGVTDLEAAGEVDLFVGFGGVEARPAVRDGAACYIADANLTPLLDFLLTENERETLERQRCD